MARLTKRTVDDAELRPQPYFIWCTELRGFGVRIFRTGRKVYYVDYRNDAGARKRMAIGPHGVLTADTARRLALATLGEVVRGEDPAEERATRRNSLTVAQLCELYLKAADRGLIMGKRGRPKKESTLATDRGRIERHIVPLLGRKLVRDLVQADVNKFIRDVARGRTAKVEKTTKKRGKAIVEGGPGTAARTAGLLGGILSFAVSEGVIAANPARGAKRPADGRRDRRLTPAEYRALGKALDATGEDAEIAQAVAGVRLLALTGCRLGEVVKLRLEEVDTAGRCLRLADSKEGASVRPIGRRAVEILTATPRRKGCPYVLPGARGDGPFGGLPGAWRRIAAKAELQGVTPHTLRHSFASVAGDIGYSESTIAALLGHAAGSVTSRYVHHLDEVLLAAADRVAATVHDYMTGRRTNVIPLKLRRNLASGKP